MNRNILKVFLAILPLILFAPAIEAQWHELPGPPSGPVNAFAPIDSSSNGRIYAATANGVYRTTDTAHSWQLMGLAEREVLKITQYKIKGQDVLLAIVRDNNIDRVCISSDSAKTFDTAYTATTEPILEIFQDGNDIVIGTAGSSSDTNAGIFRSSDLGRNWTHQAPGPPTASLTDFTLGVGFIYGIVSGGVWDMPSASNAWKQSSYPLSNAQSLQVVGQDLFVGGTGRIDISTDKGVTWLPIVNFGLDTTLDELTAFSLNGLTIIAAGPKGAYRTTDGGSNWQNIEGTGGYPKAYYTNAIAFLDNQFFAAAEAGVTRSPDGISWSYASDGLIGKVLDIISHDTTLFALTERGVFRSFDRGTTWIAPNGGGDLQDSLASSFTSIGGEIYASGSKSQIESPGLWRWNGSEWITLTDIPVISIAEGDGNLFASLGTYGLEESTDSGASWIDASNGIPFDTSSTDAVVAAGGRLLAFESQVGVAFFNQSERIYASDDDGKSWHFLDTLPRIGPVYSAASEGGIIYVASTFGLSTSTDQGENWTITPQYARQFRPFGSSLIVTTLDSIYSTGNSDVSIFSDSTAGLLNAFTNDKQFAYAATNSRGLWAEPLANIPLGVRNTISPHTEFLLEVYPNPSENNATVTFNLPDREAVSLRIFDERGVCRATLFAGEAGPGVITIPVSLSLASGSYEAELSSDRGSSNAHIVIESGGGR